VDVYVGGVPPAHFIEPHVMLLAVPSPIVTSVNPVAVGMVPVIDITVMSAVTLTEKTVPESNPIVRVPPEIASELYISLVFLNLRVPLTSNTFVVPLNVRFVSATAPEEVPSEDRSLLSPALVIEKPGP
jgi:hypothetical protein